MVNNKMNCAYNTFKREKDNMMEDDRAEKDRRR
jgi:hypothetical protein